MFRSRTKTDLNLFDTHETWLRNQLDVWEKRAENFESLEWVHKQDFIHTFIGFGAPKKNWRALDIGSGPGIIAASVSPFVDEVVGLDICEKMLSQARDTHGDLANVSFCLGDVEEMDFPDDSFDLALARMVFHHVADCARGLAEVLRVLKPGGVLVLCEGVPPDHVTRDRYEKIFELKEERHTFSEAELINMFDRAGFENILLQPYFMRQVSLNNWLANGALEQHAIDEIRRLHIEAEPHFKSIYNLVERDGDVFMDWKFVMLRGRKRPG